MQVPSLGREIPWRWAWQPSLVFLPGESHGQRGLVSYSLQGDKESDTPEATQPALKYNILTKDIDFHQNLEIQII